MAVIGTSLGGRALGAACSTSCAITLATRDWTVWKDWLASRSLVARSRRASVAASATASCGRPQHQPAHVRAEDRERLDASIVSTVAERRSSSNIASSPKMSPGPEGGERDLAAVGVLAHRAGVAGADDVARVGLVALAEDDLARAEPARVGDLGDEREVLGRERREHRDAAEQLGGLQCAGRHVARGSTTPGRRTLTRHAISSARSPPAA